MNFETEIELLTHPYARHIPFSIWEDLFDSNITNHELKFLEISLKKISMHRKVFDKANEDQLKLWLCVLLGHKDVSADELAELGWNLELDTPILWKAACVANRADLLKVMFDNFDDEEKRDVLPTLMQEDECYGFRYAAQTGGVEVLTWLKDHSSPAMFAQQIESIDYYGFATAAEFGHLPVLQWFKEATADDTLTTMIVNNDYCAFRAAAEFERIDVLDWLRSHVSDGEFDSIDLRTVMQNFEKPSKNRPLLLEWLRKEDLRGFQVVPSFFSPSTAVKRPASDLVEPENRDTSTPVHR